jgi:hypothetical protein
MTRRNAVGAVSFSIDPTLVEFLCQELPLTTFVETGTFEGDTVASVLPLFEEIHTVDLSEEFTAKAESRFHSDESVRVYSGESTKMLASLRSQLQNKSVLYWLDAHWCVADATAGERSQCPLLDELEAIAELNSSSVVLIDDARLFLCTPPKPHDTDHWPEFHDVVRKLISLNASHKIMVINDVIAFYPAEINSGMSAYASGHSIDWLATLRRLEAIEEEREELHVALAERLALIEEMSQAQHGLHAALDERLAVIEEMRQARESTKSGGSRWARRFVP